MAASAGFLIALGRAFRICGTGGHPHHIAGPITGSSLGVQAKSSSWGGMTVAVRLHGSSDPRGGVMLSMQPAFQGLIGVTAIVALAAGLSVGLARSGSRPESSGPAMIRPAVPESGRAPRRARQPRSFRHVTDRTECTPQERYPFREACPRPFGPPSHYVRRSNQPPKVDNQPRWGQPHHQPLKCSPTFEKCPRTEADDGAGFIAGPIPRRAQSGGRGGGSMQKGG